MNTSKTKENKYTIAVVPGDGIGTEVMDATISVLNELDIEFNYIYAEAGDACLEKTGSALPQETLDIVRDADACLFGAAGETAADVIVKLRQEMKMFANKQGFNPQQMLKPIPGSTSTTNPPPKKVPGKLNSDFMNRLQNKFGGNEAKVPQPQPPKKKEEPANNINQEDNNIGQFIEEKNEQTEEQQNNNENNNETPIEEDTTPIVINPNEKDRLKILCSIIKKGGRNRLGFQTLFNELTWEERGKVEIMAINHKNNSVHIYNELSNKIEEVKVNTKFPLHLSYINLPPYLYISGGKVNGKDSTSRNEK